MQPLLRKTVARHHQPLVLRQRRYSPEELHHCLTMQRMIPVTCQGVECAGVMPVSTAS
jgi:hypothetical protein